MVRPPGLFSTWIKEHKSRHTSAVFEHCQATGHNIKPHNVKVTSDENNTIKRRVKEAIALINKGHPPWIGMRDWTYQQFTILPWGFVTFLTHKADEVWVIRRKCSFHFLNFCSEFRNSLHLRCKMGRRYVFQKSRSRLFPGSTFYHSRNLRHSSIHELVTVNCFLPHIRENWSHSLKWRFLLCRDVLAEITVNIGSIFLSFPSYFFQTLFDKSLDRKTNTVVFFFCRNLSSNNIATLDADIFSSLGHLDYL